MIIMIILNYSCGKHVKQRVFTDRTADNYHGEIITAVETHVALKNGLRLSGSLGTLVPKLLLKPMLR